MARRAISVAAQVADEALEGRVTRWRQSEAKGSPRTGLIVANTATSRAGLWELVGSACCWAKAIVQRGPERTSVASPMRSRAERPLGAAMGAAGRGVGAGARRQ